MSTLPALRQEESQRYWAACTDRRKGRLSDNYWAAAAQTCPEFWKLALPARHDLDTFECDMYTQNLPGYYRLPALFLMRFRTYAVRVGAVIDLIASRFVDPTVVSQPEDEDDLASVSDVDDCQDCCVTSARPLVHYAVEIDNWYHLMVYVLCENLQSTESFVNAGAEWPNVIKYVCQNCDEDDLDSIWRIIENVESSITLVSAEIRFAEMVYWAKGKYNKFARHVVKNLTEYEDCLRCASADAKAFFVPNYARGICRRIGFDHHDDLEEIQRWMTRSFRKEFREACIPKSARVLRFPEAESSPVVPTELPTDSDLVLGLPASAPAPVVDTDLSLVTVTMTMTVKKRKREAEKLFDSIKKHGLNFY